jgi:hypothetical protein
MRFVGLIRPAMGMLCLLFGLAGCSLLENDADRMFRSCEACEGMLGEMAAGAAGAALRID